MATDEEDERRILMDGKTTSTRPKQGPTRRRLGSRLLLVAAAVFCLLSGAVLWVDHMTASSASASATPDTTPTVPLAPMAQPPTEHNDSSSLRLSLPPPFYRPASDPSFPAEGSIRYLWELDMTEAGAGTGFREEPARRASCRLRMDGYGAYRDYTQEPSAWARAHRCLRDTSIVFVGDSITRYQYLNLVNFLENGVWGQAEDPQMENERHWHGWASFLQGTNAVLHGREICDCHRQSPPSRPGNIENRYYFHPGANISVSFLQWFNDAVGYRGHDLGWLNVTAPAPRRQRLEARMGGAPLSPPHPAVEPGSFVSTQTGCVAGGCNDTGDGDGSPHVWSHDLYGLFDHVVPQLQPDYLIFNRGHWGRLPGDYDLKRLAAAVKEAVRASGGRAIFRTTTPKSEPEAYEPEDGLKTLFLQEGIDTFDAAAMTVGLRPLERQLNSTGSHVYWDHVHFLAPVYAGLNSVLLNFLCEG